jgi:hypothetical protein
MFIVVPTPFAISQVPDTTKYGVKITYPSDGEAVSDGGTNHIRNGQIRRDQ